MNKTLHTLGALTIAAALNLFTTACSSDDIMVNDEPQPEQPAAVKTYQLSIPATMADDGQTRVVSFDGTNCSRIFDWSEYIRVYNVTRQDMMGRRLVTYSLSSDRKTCQLGGTVYGDIAADDDVKLFYNLNNFDETDLDRNYFFYQRQDGTQSGVIDGAEATATVSSYIPNEGHFTTKETASFRPVQSMFRFQFEDKSNNNPINVKLLRISSTNNALDIYYYPLDDNNTQNLAGDYFVTLGNATTDYIYAALRINESRSNGDVLTFTVIDNDGNSYQGTRPVPNGGLKNGKYYYNSQAIQLTKQESTAPDITWTKPSTPVTPNANKVYNISGDDITISGISNGYSFSLTDGAPFTVRLNNLTAWYNAADPYSPFIDNNGNLILEVNDTNTINCKGSFQAVEASYGGTLKFKGNGTLTVTTQYSARCGLYSNNYKENNNAYTNISEADVSSQLAAPGYTVTRSAVINNDDGTYTWTYTVAPTVINGKFSINNRGNRVYFSPGNLQATTTDLGATWTWHFAENQWDYIGANAANNSISDEPGKVSENGTIDLFGWVGESANLTGAAQYGIIKTISEYNTTHYGNVAGEPLKSNWSNTIGSDWRMLTPSEWDYLFNFRNVQYRYAFATINSDNVSGGVIGLILFPDDFSYQLLSEIEGLQTINTPTDWGTNTLTTERWAAFAAKGCVFLPAAGSRSHNNAVYSGSGCYWSSLSPSDPSDSNAEIKAFYLHIGTGNYKLKVDNSTTRIYGHSVRLVYPVE